MLWLNYIYLAACDIDNEGKSKKLIGTENKCGDQDEDFKKVLTMIHILINPLNKSNKRN